ncbi:MAG: flagellar motor switch protein FliG [Spirochaetaceae bacterium]|jgi:flagellar motor switch protein FliG|nr:flagellar motor switch protein FliG [Spirochaetaceae bacterium]
MRELNPPEKPLQGTAERGLAAYRQTIQGKEADPAAPKPEKNKTPGKKNTRGVLELLKTDAGAKLLETRFKETKKEEKEKTPEEKLQAKYRRVAKLLILIGPEEAAPILSHLDPEQVEILSKEIAVTRGVTAEEAAAILIEFRSLLSGSAKYSAQAVGGVTAARELLHTAFGPEKGEALLRRTVPAAAAARFAFLEDLTGEQLMVLFKDESLPAEALVLSKVSPKLAGEVLNNSPPQRKIELIRRIAHLDKTSPEVLERVAAALKEKVKRLKEAVGPQTDTEIDGLNVLSAILKSSDPSFGERILQEFGSEDPYLQADLKERLNTLDDVIKAEDRAIQTKLFSMTDQEIVLLLKNRSPEFTEKVLSNMTAERRSYIKDEADILGPVLRRDADKVAKEFLDWFREKREKGEILLINDTDVVI